MMSPTEVSSDTWDRVVGTLRLRLSDPSTLVMSGSVLDMDPGTLLMPHIRDVHERIVRQTVRTFNVDVRALSFVNSSGIRVFIDWLGLIQRSKAAYTLRVIMDPGVTWQRLTFGALESVGRGLVVLDKRTKGS
jgi:ABC-type transporter Mla MlaB component